MATTKATGTRTPRKAATPAQAPVITPEMLKAAMQAMPKADLQAMALNMLEASGVKTEGIKLPKAARNINGESFIIDGAKSQSGKTQVHRHKEGAHFGIQFWADDETRALSGFNGRVRVTIEAI